MKFIVKNVNLSVSVSLTVLRFAGLWAPDDMTPNQKMLYTVPTVFCFIYAMGVYLMIQVVDLVYIWGDLELMTGVAFLFFTNAVHVTKVVNILHKKRQIQDIINDCDIVLRSEESEAGKAIVKRCNRETLIQQVFYILLTFVTAIGWATSAEKNQLPLPAWYPYDTSKSPAYELTYVHQVSALLVAALLNISKDTLVTTLIAQCRCRLQLLGLALKTLCEDIKIKGKLTPHQEEIADTRLRACVLKHQTVLDRVLQLQTCFSKPTFLQFTVSLVIICVTAFQLVSQTGNPVRLMSMGTYLLNMMYQVFIYCYQGNNLSTESSEVAGAAYECPWYACSVRLRRAMLIIMSRTSRVARLTAGGFTTLSLASFMAIIKASYSLFTLLQQVTK